MDRIFHHDDTMYEAATKVYVKTDGYAYSDSKCTVKIPADVLEDLFVRGMIVVDSAGVMYKPISCKTAAKVVTVTYACRLKCIDISSDGLNPRSYCY